MGREEKTVEIMYGEEDLALFPAFQGGFINFGYWESVPSKPTVADRVKSSEALYRKVFATLGEAAGGECLEVGCGRGLGCRLLEETRHPRQLVGLDATPAQIERAKNARAPGSAVVFQEGRAEALPFLPAAFTAIYSVEAAQHFPSLPAFLTEAFRCLKPRGRLAITTFFAQDAQHFASLAALLPTIASGIDRVPAVRDVAEQIQRAGFENVQNESIGARVWEGLDRWLVETPQKNGWGRNWLKAYRSGWLDYYLLSADKLQEPANNSVS